MTEQPDVSQAARQLTSSLSALLESIAGYAHTQLDRLGGSLERERRRRAWVLASGVTLAVSLLFGLLFAGLGVIAAFWDTHRVLTIAAVAGGYFLLAAAAGWVLWSKRRRQPTAFDWLLQVVALLAEYRRHRR